MLPIKVITLNNIKGFEKRREKDIQLRHSPELVEREFPQFSTNQHLCPIPLVNHDIFYAKEEKNRNNRKRLKDTQVSFKLKKVWL